MSEDTSTPGFPVAKRSPWFWLRFAVSVFFGLLTVALLVLWVRSYIVRDAAWGWHPSPIYLQLESNYGDIKLQANGENHKSAIYYSSTLAPEPFYHHLSAKFDSPTRFGWWWTITVPFGLVVTSTTLLTTAFWLPWHFSLRTMLVVTTLIAVVLGLVAWMVR